MQNKFQKAIFSECNILEVKQKMHIHDFTGKPSYINRHQREKIHEGSSPGSPVVKTAPQCRAGLRHLDGELRSRILHCVTKIKNSKALAYYYFKKLEKVK